MGEVSLSGKLPRGDGDGLGVLARSLIREPDRVHAVIALIDCTRVTTETDSGETIPTARIKRIETIADDDLKEAQRLIRRAWERRGGGAVLPIELETDLDAIFSGIDLDVEPEQQAASDGGDDDEAEK